MPLQVSLCLLGLFSCNSPTLYLLPSCKCLVYVVAQVLYSSSNISRPLRLISFICLISYRWRTDNLKFQCRLSIDSTGHKNMQIASKVSQSLLESKGGVVGGQLNVYSFRHLRMYRKSYVLYVAEHEYMQLCSL